MGIRLRIVVDEKEAAAFRRCAERENLTLGEWIRRVLRRAASAKKRPTARERLAALDRALKCGHPTGDIEEILADIERGRGLR